jgi:hypothetical protein
MVRVQETGGPTLYERWSRAVASMVRCQLTVLDAQYQAGLKIMETVLGVPAPGAGPGPAGPEGSRTAEELRRLERLTAERVRKGLAPPPEVYRAPYRNRIDWSRFPDWARPSDPELFEGSAHEG